ncbi:glycosyltransferase [Lutibacter sp.]|uniref:glycosyltransferase n=1 Tax=Lutibacter sp. TaxID=1925666 RepID=UPI003562AB1A
MAKTCLIYNYAQHYRAGIFKLIDKDINCDFYFGDKMGDVKKMNYAELSNFKKELKNRKLVSHFYWQSGAVSLIFKKYKKYIVLGEYYCLSTWVLLFLCKFSNKKVFLWSHGWYGNEGFIKRIIKKIFFNLSDGIFLYGNYAKGLMIKEGFDENKLHVIYNSLDYESQLKIRENLKESNIYKNHFKNEFPTIIFIGRLTRVKKLEQIVELQKILREKNIEVNVVLVGEGEEKEKLKTLAAENGIKNIWFYGACYNEVTIGELIYNATMCVSPGNVGLTAMHAMVYGTPVLTNDTFSEQMPEFEAIETGVTGAFFKKNDLASIAKTSLNWLQNKKDRLQVREACFQKIDTYFNPKYQIRVIKNVLNEEQTT